MRRVLKWTLWALLALFLLSLPFIHSILAVQAPVNAPVAVVEGWMPEERLCTAADTLLARGYTKVHTTGTVRPFAYYLLVNEAVDVVLREDVTGEVMVMAAGQDGAYLQLLSGADTLRTWALSTAMQRFSHTLSGIHRQFRLRSINPAHPESTTSNVYTLRFEVNGLNVHGLQQETRFVRTDGRMEEAWPTYAHAAAAKLVACGIPAERVQAIPTWGRPDSRSWGNAATFGAYAQREGYTAVDLISLGVHARRSRNLMRRGCGPSVTVGVISLDDPRCPRVGWWKHWKGWFYVLKEVVGASVPYAVDITR
ncbi:MAG: hypothetical protein JNL05_05965 [Flavobacteriales bacterium]|nr:hypothetical protein [Flavobacteriales bacterium]